jgi:hypothetical protein
LCVSTTELDFELDCPGNVGEWPIRIRVAYGSALRATTTAALPHARLNSGNPGCLALEPKSTSGSRLPTSSLRLDRLRHGRAANLN